VSLPPRGTYSTKPLSYLKVYQPDYCAIRQTLRSCSSRTTSLSLACSSPYSMATDVTPHQSFGAGFRQPGPIARAFRFCCQTTGPTNGCPPFTPHQLIQIALLHDGLEPWALSVEMRILPASCFLWGAGAQRSTDCNSTKWRWSR
jgi:hypothetical protein